MGKDALRNQKKLISEQHVLKTHQVAVKCNKFVKFL